MQSGLSRLWSQISQHQNSAFLATGLYCLPRAFLSFILIKIKGSCDQVSQQLGQTRSGSQQQFCPDLGEESLSMKFADPEICYLRQTGRARLMWLSG